MGLISNPKHYSEGKKLAECRGSVSGIKNFYRIGTVPGSNLLLAISF
jgi:hypothetical protein